MWNVTIDESMTTNVSSMVDNIRIRYSRWGKIFRIKDYSSIRITI